MQIKEKLTFTITFVNGKAREIKEFKDTHPNLTHPAIYLRGVETLLKETNK